MNVRAIDLSVIVVNWNTRDLLAQCLQSVYDTAGDLACEVLVVDNGSTDGSVEMVESRFPQARLFRNAENVGFARANNQALEQIKGRYALLLNSDTIVFPGALFSLVTFADRYPQAGIVGCRLVNPDGSLQRSWARFPTCLTELLGWNPRTRRLIQRMPRVYEVDWLGGACILARSEAVEDVGLLDESFFMYSEEMDWCFRMKRSGWRVCYLDDIRIMHRGGGSANRASLTQLILLYNSKLQFFSKHHGSGSVRFLRTGLVVMNTFGLLRRGLAWHLGVHRSHDMTERLEVQWKLILWLLQKYRHGTIDDTISAAQSARTST